MKRGYEDLRMEHLVRMTEVWQQLCSLDMNEKSEQLLDFSFISDDKHSADALMRKLSADNLSVCTECGNQKRYFVTGTSGPIRWSEEQILKWADYLTCVCEETGCELEGCYAT